MSGQRTFEGERVEKCLVNKERSEEQQGAHDKGYSERVNKNKYLFLNRHEIVRKVRKMKSLESCKLNVENKRLTLNLEDQTLVGSINGVRVDGGTNSLLPSQVTSPLVEPVQSTSIDVKQVLLREEETVVETLDSLPHLEVVPLLYSEEK